MADSYRGVFGAIPYAIRHTESWTMRVYGVVGALAAGLIATVVTLALVVWMAETANAQGGTFLFSRSLYVLAGFAAVAPLLAPLLFVARRHRRDDPVRPGYDRKLAYGGFLFLLSLYVGMVISAPAALREPTESAVVGALYALPRLAGVVPPVAAALVVFAVHYRLRVTGDAADEATPSTDDPATDNPATDNPATDDSATDDRAADDD